MFNCNLCDKGFRHKSSLSRHHKLHNMFPSSSTNAHANNLLGLMQIRADTAVVPNSDTAVTCGSPTLGVASLADTWNMPVTEPLSPSNCISSVMSVGSAPSATVPQLETKLDRYHQQVMEEVQNIHEKLRQHLDDINIVQQRHVSVVSNSIFQEIQRLIRLVQQQSTNTVPVDFLDDLDKLNRRASEIFSKK